MTTLLIHIKELVNVRPVGIKKLSGSEMKELPILKNAYLLIEDELIAGYGLMEDIPKINANKTIDCTGKLVLPAWCDSHTHLVFAGNRTQEFIDRIHGLSYEEIAKRGGGILNSAKKLQETSEDELYLQSAKRLEQVINMGTGAIEIKSGYGLSMDAELKMLRVIQRLQKNYPITIKATYLAAHALPKEYNNSKSYVDEVISKYLPEVAALEVADFIDVFCETGYFSTEDTDRLLTAGEKFGLQAKIHVNQFTDIGGVQIAVKHKALSVDHLEIMSNEAIASLQNTETIPVALPLCSHFLSIPYTPVRKLIDAGLAVALATDYNPGSSPSGNMNQVISEACIKMKMTPEEAINAATINAAYAMNLAASHGSITIGKKANILLTKAIPNFGFLPYDFGANNIDKVFINGTVALS